MANAWVIETSVTNNSLSEDSSRPSDHTRHTTAQYVPKISQNIIKQKIEQVLELNTPKYLKCTHYVT